jgi:hypothetical protein
VNHRLRTILATTVTLALLGGAFAGNWHLRLRAPVLEAVTDRLPTARMGAPLFELQEGVHGLITAATGVSVPHDYLWLHIGKTSIPIDPIRFSK